MKKFVPIFLLLTVLLLLQLPGISQNVQTGKSYVNLTKGLNGGTIEAGDTLEIRATIAVGNWATNPITITRVHFNDTIPANTTYITNSLKILTNEGLTWRSFTDANDADQGRRNGNFIRINLGSTYNGNNAASVNPGTAPPNSAAPGGTTGGTIRHNGRPSFYGGICIMSASYRIVVNAGLSYGTIINMAGGAFRYNDGSSDIVSPLLPYTISLTENVGLCTNSIGANAIIDNGGTFGSGNIQNRSTSAIVPGYNFTVVASGTPDDGSYAIVNNLSPTGSTNINMPKPDNAATSSRVFTLWDIMGDHTGAAAPAAGNPPVAPGNTGGYFVAINASYANNNAIQQTIGGLCPNTYYEFSAWFKNICEYCACDSTGDAPYRNSGGTMIPNTNFNGPDSSGVNPNLTFTVDGIDYYTTGTLKYTGQWVKKGFIYKTGPAQTGFTLTIRNNAAGGGGNDWGIDDVTLATCSPNLDLRPSPSIPVCYGNTVDMYAVIRSFFPNYTQWRWERSTDGGANWVNTGIGGTGSPVLVSGEYEYTAAYPTFLSDSGTHLNQYRIRIASTNANLDNENCSFAATTTILVLVNDCSEVLSTSVSTFGGTVINGKGNIFWNVANETENTVYEVESSTDKVHFTKIGSVQGDGSTNYHFTDPVTLAGQRFYRVKIVKGDSYKYSKIILLTNGTLEFAVKTLSNPFASSLQFEVMSPEDDEIQVTLLDIYGRVIRQSKENISKGITSVQITRLNQLSAGIYLLQVKKKDEVIIKRLMKENRK